VEKMVRKQKRKQIIIELFKKNDGEKVRTIRFRKSEEFHYFLNSFQQMRYPGYDWRYISK
jgi:hypothetical protein